ncbi:MAG: molybdopterin biosynthesis protein, partial [Clostridia bacterium]|nr:molybdopterin biosynthesis protein [Clostridia bacterium]
MCIRDRATPVQGGAGVITSLVKSDGMIEVPVNAEGLEAGQEVEVSLRKSPEELSKSFVIIGSHDPLIDELSDIVRKTSPEFSIASTHAGSLGGILALKRGEAHGAGTHLLDPQTGEYNLSYLKKYLKGRFAVVRAVDRIQGFMVAMGNPLNIKTVTDLKMTGARYVNRQKGSGTRVLFDDLLMKEGLGTQEINGYHREEFTHLAVAVQIASAGADCGMGIYSAAQAYGLDFIPICKERYDFVIPESALEDPRTRAFFSALTSDDFKDRLERLGGYTLDNPGAYEVYEL